MFGGFQLLWRYEATPGPVGQMRSQWPTATSIEPHQKLPTLVMFAHPRCPCTRASLAQLATLMAHNQGRVDARVVFFQPEDADEQWSQSDLYYTAQAIPGVSVMLDRDNVEARRFAAKTSGYTLLFDRDGRLLFSGGITAARGHIGDNAGSAALSTLLEERAPLVRGTLVFGCPLSASEPD
ncbi:MAG: hypothetical protein HY288_14665 [Planctomycetia bacterium]|nr:hypothetical protein [Planctomycetia bacterium]